MLPHIILVRSIARQPASSSISPTWGIAAFLAFTLLNRFAPRPKRIEEVKHLDKSPTPEIEKLAQAILNNTDINSALLAIQTQPTDLIENALYLACKKINSAKLECEDPPPPVLEISSELQETIWAASRALIATEDWVRSIDTLSNTLSDEDKTAPFIFQLITKEFLTTLEFRENLENASKFEDVDRSLMQYIQCFYKGEIQRYCGLIANRYPDHSKRIKLHERDKALITLFNGPSISLLEDKLTTIIEEGFPDELKALFQGKPLKNITKNLQDSKIDQEIIDLLIEMITGEHLPETSHNLIERKRLELSIDRRNTYDPDNAPEALDAYLKLQSKPHQAVMERQVSQSWSALENSLKNSSSLFPFAIAYGEFKVNLAKLTETSKQNFDPKGLLSTHVKDKVEAAETKAEASQIWCEYQELVKALRWTIEEFETNQIHLITSNKAET